MAIEIIPNQPVLFRPAGWREPCECKGCETDCMMVQGNDYVYAQVKINACGDDFICGQPSLENLGDELINPGSWSETLGWGFITDWCNDGTGGVLSQTINPDLNEYYFITFTISGRTTGDVTLALGGTASSGNPYSANGAYEAIILAGAGTDIEFTANNAFDGCLSDMSVKRIADCWSITFSGDSPFTFNDTGVCVQGTGSLFTDTLANTPGYYVASFTISNYISGTVEVSGACTDTWVGSPFSLNGEKFAYGVFAAPGVLCFEFTDFFGCISDVQLHKLFVPQFVIENQTTGDQFLNLNDGAYLSFVEDRAIIKFQPVDFLTYDCYKICIIDTCLFGGAPNLITNGTFDSDLSDWSAGSGWAWDATNGGQALFDRSSGTGSLEQEFSVSDVNVCARITVNDIAGAGAFVRFHLYNAANASVTFLDITTPGVYSICGLGNRIDVEPSNLAGTIVEVDNIGIFSIADCEDCNKYDYCSDCIKFAESFDSCVLLLESYNDENGSWGFVWNNSAGTNVFKLSHRIAAKLWHPVYPEESNDYTFSDGKTSDTFGQSDKVWTLGIDPASERAHDVIRLQKRSDHFVITDINETKEYWAEKGDYNPDWPDGGCRAPANIKVKLKTSTLYNNLCSV